MTSAAAGLPYQSGYAVVQNIFWVTALLLNRSLDSSSLTSGFPPDCH